MAAIYPSQPYATTTQPATAVQGFLPPVAPGGGGFFTHPRFPAGPSAPRYPAQPTFMGPTLPRSRGIGAGRPLAYSDEFPPADYSTTRTRREPRAGFGMRQGWSNRDAGVESEEEEEEEDESDDGIGMGPRGDFNDRAGAYALRATGGPHGKGSTALKRARFRGALAAREAETGTGFGSGRRRRNLSVGFSGLPPDYIPASSGLTPTRSGERGVSRRRATSLTPPPLSGGMRSYGSRKGLDRSLGGLRLGETDGYGPYGPESGSDSTLGSGDEDHYFGSRETGWFGNSSNPYGAATPYSGGPLGGGVADNRIPYGATASYSSGPLGGNVMQVPRFSPSAAGAAGYGMHQGATGAGYALPPGSIGIHTPMASPVTVIYTKGSNSGRKRSHSHSHSGHRRHHHHHHRNNNNNTNNSRSRETSSSPPIFSSSNNSPSRPGYTRRRSRSLPSSSPMAPQHSHGSSYSPSQKHNRSGAPNSADVAGGRSLPPASPHAVTSSSGGQTTPPNGGLLSRIFGKKGKGTSSSGWGDMASSMSAKERQLVTRQHQMREQGYNDTKPAYGGFHPGMDVPGTGMPVRYPQPISMHPQHSRRHRRRGSY